ncbi:leptin receptor isoform X2 [Cyprinodon tularosa]|nr:leptin receptor isoform X2 [Cyprinodon tularosa]XP_038134314.1 leptin receptor isoform X2 [Cyprinodon tularosa]XP_038134315.1 leptin receptor isoform X2 [Cyprinodon tularosa]
MLKVQAQVLLVLQAVYCLEPGVPVYSRAMDLPWQDELCCDSPSANVLAKTGTNESDFNLPHPLSCIFRSSIESSPSKHPGATCLDIMCRLDENWANVTCDLKTNGQLSDRLKTNRLALSLQHLSQINRTDEPASDHRLVCTAEESLMCSIHLNSTRTFGVLVTVNISSVVASTVLLKIPDRPVKPSPPFNISHNHTLEAELILSWKKPLNLSNKMLKYEVRYSWRSFSQTLQVVSALEQPYLSLDLEPSKYTIQVRCTTQTQPPLWSDWSKPYIIYLESVTYVPQEVVARPGENVTVYCVLKDRNASSANWSFNYQKWLDPSLYHPVSQQVSKITFRASDTGMYYLLRCRHDWSIPYTKIFVEGGSINITCVTNGDIDTMTCKWDNNEKTKLKFQSKSADMSCEDMKKIERGSKNVGETGPECTPNLSSQKTCSIHPLKTNNCYKLWLELPSPLIRSKPVYVFPLNYVKPHPPADVVAVTQSKGILNVSWTPPPLPVDGLQCQFRYHSLSVIEWKFEKSVHVSWAEVEIPDMCQVYEIQVRCLPKNGFGYWSEWSEPVQSTIKNSRAPERGPDFWRIIEEDPDRNKSNVTLLFETFQPNWDSYCVDGFIVQHQASHGSKRRRRIDIMSSYSFEWNHELHIVTVEAYNSLGSSVNNVNMTLEYQPKRRCIHSIHVSLINSTCVSLSWSLLHIRPVPLFLVVQWFPKKEQDSKDFGLSKQTWARLPYTNPPVHLRGVFFSSEEYDFHLYPVFADGEGERISTLLNTRTSPTYIMLIFILIISIAVFLILVLSQNQMKKIIWKDVPNPNNCSWAKGLDPKTMENFEYMFRSSEGLQALPLPTEKFSKVIVGNKALTEALVQTSMSPDSFIPSTNTVLQYLNPRKEQLLECDLVFDKASVPKSVTNFNITSYKLQPGSALEEQGSGSTNGSARSSVTYSKVLLTDAKEEHLPPRLHNNDGSRSSSSDEGNFSANNSDTSESVTSGLWELDSCRGTESDDQRHSGSYNSFRKLSETSEKENELDMRQDKPLNYLEIRHPLEDEESEEENPKSELLKTAHVELHHQLNQEEVMDPSKLLQACSSLYMPQYRKHEANTIPHT